jgi:Domain of unknown function (DUF4234)
MQRIPAVQQVDRFVHRRRFTDRILVSWPLYFFLLSWVTLGVYSVVVAYRRWERADLFRQRRVQYYGAVVAATRQYAEESGRYGPAHDELDDLQRLVTERFEDEHRPIRAGRSLVLSFLTLGVYGWYAIWRLMRFWWQVQLTEEVFDDRLSLLWTKLGIIRYPLTFEADERLNRSFPLHLFLTAVTFGIYGIVWDYRLHTDPEKIFPEFHALENAVLDALRTASP